MGNWYNRWFNLMFMASLFVVVGCKHEPFDPQVVSIPVDTTQSDTNDVVERCVDFDTLLGDCQIGPFYNDLNPAFMYPAINPNNPNEFAYYVNKKVYKHDMISNTSTLLADNIHVISRMDWGAKGWITFSTLQWKVWLLRDDGTSLKQVTFTPRDLGPEFNPDGNKIVYSRTEYQGGNKLLLIDLQGNPIDSFCRQVGSSSCSPWLLCSWSSNGQKLAAPERGIEVYDLKGNSLGKPFVAGQDVADIPDIEWIPDDENILFITRYGKNRGTIYSVNVNTGVTTMIKEGCENRFYADLSISPDGSFMLAQKGKAVVDGCDVNIKWRIVKMDLDGNKEEIIDLKD